MLLKPKALTLIVLGSIFLIACGFFFPFGRSPHGMNPGFGYQFSNFNSNGEQIYFTATNDHGEYIQYTGGPPFGGMMGGALACVSCHGEDGRGGQHVMHMDVMDAPDIRFEALSAEEGEHQTDEHEDAHGEEYDLETFRKVVVLGQHPDGDALSRDMPRWDMSEDDLVDLFEYIQTLP
jgi:hypothetical protein